MIYNYDLMNNEKNRQNHLPAKSKYVHPNMHAIRSRHNNDNVIWSTVQHLYIFISWYSTSARTFISLYRHVSSTEHFAAPSAHRITRTIRHIKFWIFLKF